MPTRLPGTGKAASRTAQSPAKFYVAGLFYPPRAPEDAHTHAHHVAHREHAHDGEPAAP